MSTNGIIDSGIEVHADESVTPRTLQRSIKSGKVQFYRVRKNHTIRHIPYIAPGTPAREIAEQVETLVEEKHQSIATIAETMGVSQPTVRRHLERLRFARAVEKVRGAKAEELLARARRG